jgi:hypothetical protein
VVPGLMDGLENLNRLVTHAVDRVRKNRSGERTERAERTNTGASRSRLRVAGRKPR